MIGLPYGEKIMTIC